MQDTRSTKFDNKQNGSADHSVEFRELANAMPQLVWIARNDGVVTYYNDRVEEFAGARRREDGSWEWEGLLHPDDLGPTEQAWTRAVEKGTLYQIEHRVKLKDGQYRWFLSRGVPQYDEQGKIRKWFGTATDIHEAKTLASLLEAKVAERTREYEMLNRALRLSNDELLRFAHIASHDMKEPLRKIRLFGNMFMGAYGDAVPDQGKLLLTKLIRSSERLNNLVDGILNYSTVELKPRDMEPCALNEMLAEVVADLELVIEDKGATVQYGNLPVIYGNKIYLQQLFFNLINNSLKFSGPENKPRVRIEGMPLEDKDRQLLEAQHKHGAFSKVSITDNGIGFEPEYAEKIFGVLERLHSKEAFDGTGLGLALCRKIVDKHNGLIYAESAPGEGAVFHILLPMFNPPGHRRASAL